MVSGVEFVLGISRENWASVDAHYHASGLGSSSNIAPETTARFFPWTNPYPGDHDSVSPNFQVGFGTRAPLPGYVEAFDGVFTAIDQDQVIHLPHYDYTETGQNNHSVYSMSHEQPLPP